MRLLYWYTRFLDNRGLPKDYHGLKDFEINLSTKVKYHFDKETYVFCGELYSAPIPDGFWGEQPLYNISAVIGNNGAGKTTVINTVIDTLNEIYENDVRGSNETIFFVENGGRYRLVHLVGGSPKDETVKCAFSKTSPLRINLHDDTSAIVRLIGLDRTKIIYLTNTLSAADDERAKSIMRQHQSRYNFIYDCSLCGTIRNWLVDDPYGRGEDALSLFFVDEYYKQVKFVCNHKQQELVTTLTNRGLPVPTPKRLNIVVRGLSDKNDLLPGFREVLSKLDSDADCLIYVLCVACYYNFLNDVGEKAVEVNSWCKEFSGASKRSFYKLLRLKEKNADDYRTTKQVRSYLGGCREFVRFVYESKAEFEKFATVSKPIMIGPYGGTMFSVSVSEESMNWLVDFIEKYRRICSPNFFLDFNWGLSSGENNLLRLFSSLFFVFSYSGPLLRNKKAEKQTNCNSVLLLMDEADLTYHPEWQRQLVQILAAFLPLEFGDCHVNNIQVLFSTHSPLLLGDLPANNVMCIGTGAGEKTGLSNTFGQNIHTILKDSFFLTNGIGSFASDKINETARILRDKADISSEELEKCKMVIDLVSPGILKSKLLELYSAAVEKIGEDVDEKIMSLARKLNPEELETLVSNLQKEIARRE